MTAQIIQFPRSKVAYWASKFVTIYLAQGEKEAGSFLLKQQIPKINFQELKGEIRAEFIRRGKTRPSWAE